MMSKGEMCAKITEPPIITNEYVPARRIPAAMTQHDTLDRTAVVILLLCCACWGLSQIAIKIAKKDNPEFGQWLEERAETTLRQLFEQWQNERGSGS